MVQPVTFHLISAFVLGIAGKNQAGRGIDIYLAVHVLIEQLLIEMAKPSILAGPGKVGFPPDAIVEREPWRHFPGVLAVKPHNVLAVVICRKIALEPGLCESH